MLSALNLYVFHSSVNQPKNTGKLIGFVAVTAFQVTSYQAVNSVFCRLKLCILELFFPLQYCLQCRFKFPKYEFLVLVGSIIRKVQS